MGYRIFLLGFRKSQAELEFPTNKKPPFLKVRFFVGPAGLTVFNPNATRGLNLTCIRGPGKAQGLSFFI
jgi:hypothetical protein